MGRLVVNVMALAFLSVAVFLAGWATGRWDLLAEHRGGIQTWLQGAPLLTLCACLVFLGVLYLEMTPAAFRLLGPALLEQP